MLNKVFIMGRLARDPELRRTQSGIAVASFTLAVDRDYHGVEPERTAMMGKPNTYIQLRQAQQRIAQLEVDLYYSKGFTIQQCMDFAMIAIHQEFGRGPAYNKRFERRFRQVFVEFSTLCVEDGADDEELVYTKAKLDECLRAAYGDDALAFDERYDINRMYLRDRRDDWRHETNSGVQIEHQTGGGHGA